jgi:3'-phosphoadenosine 5'-phosphosulfate (PAPS) 3'-phosphatase
MAYKKIDPEEFWDSAAGKAVLKEEREKTFAGEKNTVTMEEVEHIWKKYRNMIKSTESKV